jgi:hypothetical protein
MDMQARYEKLLTDAAECAKLRDLATDSEKRELFARLSEHLSVLASLMERALGLQRGQDNAACVMTDPAARQQAMGGSPTNLRR